MVLISPEAPPHQGEGEEWIVWNTSLLYSGFSLCQLQGFCWSLPVLPATWAILLVLWDSVSCLSLAVSKRKDWGFSATQSGPQPVSAQYPARTSAGGQGHNNKATLHVPSADGLALGQKSPTAAPHEPHWQCLGVLGAPIHLIDYSTPFSAQLFKILSFSV